eukprot:TRINITY_DN8897_c0_g1_i1.p1 TRINITY_DN8897_c0_g1~~TRINITY_DN8897_c0_g1_i1.p1  ORF type:complete len:107 (+),score=49.68 TRINITY_DN8897_c0_g1_i1:1-321(+)
MIKESYNNRDNIFFFQAEDGIRDAQESRGLGDVYKRQVHGDITLSMRFFTINSSIKIHAEHKPDIVGFMKPPGVEVEDSLKISIRYSFRGIEFFRVFEEDKEIELP